MRTDSHNNPTAFTTDIARQAGLKEGEEYTQGDSFFDGHKYYYTARLIGDPLDLTIRVIDRIGFYAGIYGQRWSDIGMPKEVWLNLSPDFKAGVIAGMYHREGGTEMVKLFPRSFIF